METHGNNNTASSSSAAAAALLHESNHDDDHINNSNNTSQPIHDHTVTTTSTISPTPPDAPTKPQLRRRLFDKLRTKRRQMIAQHHDQYDIGSNGGEKDENLRTTTTTNDNGDNIKVKTKKQSLVTHYYRVDTVPRKALQLPPRKNDGTVAATDALQPHQSGGTTTTGSLGTNPLDTNGTTTELLRSPPSTKKRRNMNHPEKVVNVVLPGVPSYEEDWARDTHDYFNLIILVPVTVLNIMNWNWDILLSLGGNHISNNNHHRPHRNQNNSNDEIGYMEYYEQMFDRLQYAWTGDWFDVFFYCTAAYFIIDLLWIVILPICVKSPSTIIQHHIAVLLYIMIPYIHPNFRFCMGACMSVEINTWFLIARRVFNKQGFPPWTLIELNSWLSIRVKVISIFFYVTWISIRCILYPGLLIPFYKLWREYSIQTGTVVHLLTVACLLHIAFCLLNLKWSYELLMSKVRYFRRQYILRKQQLRHDRNHPHHNKNGAVQHRYQYQPDPSISDGL
jgi:hypothetical protein